MEYLWKKDNCQSQYQIILRQKSHVNGSDGGASGPSSKKQSAGMVSKKCTLQMERDRLGLWGDGDGQPPGTLSGLDRLRRPMYNKGMAFTLEERQTLGIHGLLPPKVKTQDEQVELCRLSLERYEDNLTKYIYLMGLLDRNERLFFRVVNEYVTDILPLVYTPTVGLACQKYGLVYRRPRGIFIAIHDRGHIYDVIKNWPEQDIRAIVVTDGERILGLGDLGANGMGIPVGKLALYTALGGIKPQHCLPITLDVGTNNQELLDDPLYIGLKEKRIVGKDYDDFIEEFMRAVVRRYGQNCLIQFEDFGNENAFRLLEKYRGKYCTFNDDIQGTAAVCVAGIMASLRITNKKFSDNVFVFQGAGEASLGIAELCVMAMVAEGASDAEARAKIWMVDSKGLIVKDRPEGGVNENKEKFARDHPPVSTLAEVVTAAKPSVLIGAAAVPGAFTADILKAMAANHDRPVIFALSNPTDKSECTAEECYANTEDRALFASGSPFPTYHAKDGREFNPGQANNAYIFPGLALGILTCGLIDITDDYMLIAAQALADVVTQENLDEGKIYPPLECIQHCSIFIAKKVVEQAYNVGKAQVFPQPVDIEAFVRAQMYDTRYGPSIPSRYNWPGMGKGVTSPGDVTPKVDPV